MTIEPFVDRDWLVAQRDEVVVADVRWYLDGRSGRHAYLQSHLPGARFLDLDSVLAGPAAPMAGRHPLPDPDVFAAGLGAAGIRPGDTVVAYDDQGGMVAGRLVWMLRVLGRPAALLEGGLQAWEGPMETGPVTVEPVVHPSQPWPSEAIATAEEVAEHLGSGGVVVDARASERYTGDVETIDPQAGHIPGAVNVPFGGLLADDRSLRPDLGEWLTARGVDGNAIVYCGSGVSACLNVLASEAIGTGRPRLYVGSWSGWSSDPSRPVETGPTR